MRRVRGAAAAPRTPRTAAPDVGLEHGAFLRPEQVAPPGPQRGGRSARRRAPRSPHRSCARRRARPQPCSQALVLSSGVPTTAATSTRSRSRLNGTWAQACAASTSAWCAERRPDAGDPRRARNRRREQLLRSTGARSTRPLRPLVHLDQQRQPRPLQRTEVMDVLVVGARSPVSWKPAASSALLDAPSRFGTSRSRSRNGRRDGSG